MNVKSVEYKISEWYFWKDMKWIKLKEEKVIQYDVKGILIWNIFDYRQMKINFGCDDHPRKTIFKLSYFITCKLKQKNTFHQTSQKNLNSQRTGSDWFSKPE